jgi:bacterioferritin
MSRPQLLLSWRHPYPWRQNVQPVSPRVVELLNDALTFELTVTNTYFLHARMLDNWGLPRLGKVFYDLSIEEMRDADSLINRILLFDGHPNLQKLGAIMVGETPEEMLRLAFDSEKQAVAQFNASAQVCHDLGDHGTAAVFEEMVRDEEKHADWFESQLDAIRLVGLAQYLAQQIDAGESPA